MCYFISFVHKCGMCNWPKSYHVLSWFFLPKPGFLELFKFSALEITFKSIFPTIWIQILPINSNSSCPSRSFQQYQRRIPIYQKNSDRIQFNFQWRNHSIFKSFYAESPNVIKPSPCTPPRESFPKRPRMCPKASQFSVSHKYKQNKQTTFFHR